MKHSVMPALSAIACSILRSVYSIAFGVFAFAVLAIAFFAPSAILWLLLPTALLPALPFARSHLTRI